jgi:hypothetical protein
MIFKLQGLSRARAFAGLLLRFVLLAGLLWGTGFFGRIDPGFVAQDASVGNRYVLWEGGLQMIWHKPLTGWGVGESGPQFMHWFQPVDASAKYAGMVNSYLHVGVERGLPFLILCVSALMCVVCMAYFRVLGSGRKNRNSLSAALLAGATVLVVFLVANIFNTLWIFPRLWIPVGIVGAILLAVVLFDQSRLSVLKRSFGCSFVLGLLLGSVLFAYGGVLAGRAEHVICFEEHAVIFASHSNDGSPASQWLLAMDRHVFGDDWGKEVRRLAEALEGRSIELVVLPVHESEVAVTDAWGERFLLEPQEGLSSRVLLTSGALFPPSELSNAVDRIIWLHPHVTGALPEAVLSDCDSTLLLFPMMDLSGSQAMWRRAARQRDWEFTSSGALMDDVRPVWPEPILGRLH